MGLLLLVTRHTGYERDTPPEDCYRGIGYSIVLLSCSLEVGASASVDSASPQSAEIGYISVCKRGSPYSMWSCGTEGRGAYAHDMRSGKTVWFPLGHDPGRNAICGTLQSPESGERARLAGRLALFAAYRRVRRILLVLRNDDSSPFDLLPIPPS
jgi:hypothetical protein